MMRALALLLCLLPGLAAGQSNNYNILDRYTATITGGTIDGTVIGGTTPAAGTFTTLKATALTSGRVTFATTGGALTDSANLTFDGTSLALAAAGSTSATTLQLGGSANRGFYAPASGTLGAVVGGVEVVRFISNIGPTLRNDSALAWATSSAYSTADTFITRYDANHRVMISGDGTGATTNAGAIIGYSGDSGFGGLWPSTTATPSSSNYTLYFGSSSTWIGTPAAGSVYIAPNNIQKMQVIQTAGAGPAITAGTAASAVSALTVTQTRNFNSSATDYLKYSFTLTSNHASDKIFNYYGGAGGVTSLMSLATAGDLTLLGPSLQITAAGSGVVVANGGYYNWAGRSTLRASADGVLSLLNNAETRAVIFRATGVPTCSSNCGTSPSVVGVDSAGTVTMGASGSPASGWVLTFNGTWGAAPACHVSPALAGMAVGKLPIVVATSTTTMTVTTNGTAPANSDVYTYQCTQGV